MAIKSSEMKFEFALILLVLTVNAAADRVVPSDRVRHHVNVFEQASGQSNEIGELRVGQSFELVGSISRWHEVELPDGRNGFVSRSWTRVVEEPGEDQDELVIHYLNVGAGTCTVVECPGQNAPPMIVDCGSVGRHNGLTDTQARNYIENVLNNHDPDPNVVISHPHTDHYGMIAEVLENVQSANIWLGGDTDGYEHRGFPTWLADQRDGGATVHEGLPQNFHNDEQAMPGTTLGCGDAEVFTLTVNTGNSPNVNSHVLEIRYDDFGATFTGDAEGETESQALANYNSNVKTTVLTSSHHGSASNQSNHQAWADATSPEVVIYSAGNRFGHPHCTVLPRYRSDLATAPEHPLRCGTSTGYENSQSRLAEYLTATNGVVVVRSDGTSPLTLTCTLSTGCTASIDH